MIISRILVPTDFSPHAQRAFSYATTLAQRLGAKLVLLHVVEDPFATGAWNSQVYVPNVAELMENLIADARKRLEKAKESATRLGLPAETEVVTGRPAQVIVDYAKDGKYDLIVMGTRGRTGVSQIVMGSVAERVVRRAACPVLTVRAPESARTTSRPAAA